jgi:fatty-acyl-CoA synthase
MLLAKIEAHRGAGVSFLDGTRLNYPEMWDRARRFAGGLPKVDVALIFLPMGPEAVVAFVGCMVAGVMPSFMPLPSEKQDPAAYWESHRALFRHIDEGLIIAPETFLADIRAAVPDNPLTLMAVERLRGGEPVDTVLRDEAFLQHSSGTTGLKKGVVITHDQLGAQLDAYADRLRLTKDSVIVSWLPLYHDMGLIACMLLPLWVGCEVVYLDTFRWSARPKLLFRAIEEHRGTHVWMPNFAFSHMANMPIKGFDLSSLQAFINCSEVCKPEAFERFQTAFAGLGVRPDMLTCCYAMAETVFAITQSSEAPKAIDGVLSSGAPVEGVKVRIVDEDGKPADYGQIEVRGEFVFGGYFKDVERTKAAFRDGWYRTRDLGMMRDGELYVAGRTDDMIIVNGRNLFAHQVEAEASKVEGVIPGRAVAFGVDMDGATALAVVCETTKEGLEPTVVAAVNSVFGIMPRVTTVGAKTLLKTTSGKMDRKKNRERYLNRELASWS